MSSTSARAIPCTPVHPSGPGSALTRKGDSMEDDTKSDIFKREMKAMRNVVEILDSLPVEVRQRVIGWLCMHLARAKASEQSRQCTGA